MILSIWERISILFPLLFNHVKFTEKCGFIFTELWLSQVTFNGSFDHMSIDATRYLYCHGIYLSGILKPLSFAILSFFERYIHDKLHTFKFVVFTSILLVWNLMIVSIIWKSLSHSILQCGAQAARKKVCLACSRQQKLLEGMRLPISVCHFLSLATTHSLSRACLHTHISIYRCFIFIFRSRLLRANLLQPLKDIETINARLDCLVSIGCAIYKSSFGVV